MAMTESELIALTGDAEREAVTFNGEFMAQNERFLNDYLANQRGDEKEGQSKVVSNDVADVVESDMPSLIRVFAGPHDIMEFEPTTGSELDISEAREKTAYINWIVKHQKNSFKFIYDWLKDAEIQKCAVVKYDYVEREKTHDIVYDGLSDIEVAEQQFQIEADLQKGETLTVVEQNTDDGENFVKWRIQRTVKKFEIRNVPTEYFIITRNASCKDDAELVGERKLITRGQLIAEGFDKDMVRNLPSHADGEDNISNMQAIRFHDEGGARERQTIGHWASQEIEIFDYYMKIDWDGDGVPERRHIIKAGNQILENEPSEIDPFAIFSTIPMPHQAIGRSRAEVTRQTQDIKTILYRQILDNIYRVNNGRVVVNDEDTNIDDLLTVRPNGIVRTSGDPRNSVVQLETPYIGQQALQVVQYVDSVRAQTTGTLLANQSLDSDALYNETATRFQGIQEAGAAKVELVTRVAAEVGFRDLFEGLAWMVAQYQNEPQEILVLGKPMTVDPRKWRHEHHLEASVGLAAGDAEQQLRSLSALLGIQGQLSQDGSPLVDSQKQFNLLAKMQNALGIKKVDGFFNNPERPEQLIMAENEQLRSQVQQLTEQVQANPLAEAEEIKARSSLIQAQAKAQLEVAKLSEDQRQFNAKQTLDNDKLESEIELKLESLEQQQRESEAKNAQAMADLIAKLELQYTTLEVNSGVDVPGSRV